MTPPASVIAVAEAATRQSPCAKSRRGAVVFGASDDMVVTFGAGFNGQPAPFACTGTARCRELCAKLCEHAEGRAIRAAAGEFHGVRMLGIALRCDLVHVKIGDDGKLTAGGGPSCWQCSRAILDCGFIDGVWLYEETAAPPFDADVRVGDLLIPTVVTEKWKRWRRYTAEEFHRTTLHNCGMLEV